VAAVVIIMLTLTILCLWSRRWKREQQKAEIMRGFPPTYLNGPQAPNPHLAATYMANLNKAAAYAQAAAAVANNTMPRHYSYQATSHEDLTAEGRMRVQQQPQQTPKDPYGHNIYASYTEQTSIHNGVFVNPQTRKPRPPKERAPQPPNERGGRGNSNKRGRDKEAETELRRQPSMRSHSNAYQQVMDQYSDLTTRSSFRSTRQQRKDHHPDLIQHTGHYYDSNSGVGSRPPKRFSRY